VRLARLPRKRVGVVAAAAVVVAVAPLRRRVAAAAVVVLQPADNAVRLRQTQRRQQLKRLQFLRFLRLRRVTRPTQMLPQQLRPAVVAADAALEVVRLRQQQAGQPRQQPDAARRPQHLPVRP